MHTLTQVQMQQFIANGLATVLKKCPQLVRSINELSQNRGGHILTAFNHLLNVTMHGNDATKIATVAAYAVAGELYRLLANKQSTALDNGNVNDAYLVYKAVCDNAVLLDAKTFVTSQGINLPQVKAINQSSVEPTFSYEPADILGNSSNQDLSFIIKNNSKDTTGGTIFDVVNPTPSQPATNQTATVVNAVPPKIVEEVKRYEPELVNIPYRNQPNCSFTDKSVYTAFYRDMRLTISPICYDEIITVLPKDFINLYEILNTIEDIPYNQELIYDIVNLVKLSKGLSKECKVFLKNRINKLLGYTMLYRMPKIYYEHFEKEALASPNNAVIDDIVGNVNTFVNKLTNLGGTPDDVANLLTYIGAGVRYHLCKIVPYDLERISKSVSGTYKVIDEDDNEKIHNFTVETTQVTEQVYTLFIPHQLQYIPRLRTLKSIDEELSDEGLMDYIYSSFNMNDDWIYMGLCTIQGDCYRVYNSLRRLGYYIVEPGKGI